MANIITSKTRGKMMRNPSDRAKVLMERRAISLEKHGVEKVSPMSGFSEIEIHEELDRQGGGIKESMEANQEREQNKAKLKKAAEAPHREKVIKERIKKLEKRDEKNGKMAAGKKFMAEKAKRRKK
jgi:hypothetical protein